MFLEEPRRTGASKRRPPDPNVGSHLPPPASTSKASPSPQPQPLPLPPEQQQGQPLTVVPYNPSRAPSTLGLMAPLNVYGVGASMGMPLADEMSIARTAQDRVVNWPIHDMHLPRPLEYVPLPLDAIFSSAWQAAPTTHDRPPLPVLQVPPPLQLQVPSSAAAFSTMVPIPTCAPLVHNVRENSSVPIDAARQQAACLMQQAQEQMDALDLWFASTQAAHRGPPTVVSSHPLVEAELPCKTVRLSKPPLSQR